MNVTQHSIVSYSTGVETLDSAKYTNKFWLIKFNII